MTYDDVKLTDREVLDALAAARREQAMLMIHAENSDCIAWLTERLEWKGMTAAKFHATSRPYVVEREATHRAISLAELLDVPMLLVHVSAKERCTRSSGHRRAASRSMARPARNTCS